MTDLSKIKARREKIAAQLQALDAAEQEEMDRRAAIAGHAVLAQAKLDEAFATTLQSVLNERVKKNRDRALFDLSTRERKPRKARTTAT